jgi:uncharacterized RDD family membrane protein YckC
MENIGIETTQNVFISHHLASVGDRLVAQLLDFLFIGAYCFTMGFIAGLISYYIKNLGSFMLILFIPVLFYSLVCEILFHGQTVAKMIMKIKVVKIDGSQPTILNCLIRWIFRIFDIYITSGGAAIFTILLNGKGQRLGDIAAGTTIIKLTPQAKLEDTLLIRLPENYQLYFENIQKLNENDINIVLDVYKFIRKNPFQEFGKVSLQAKIALELKFNDGKVINMSPLIFFKTILDDYNFVNKAL